MYWSERFGSGGGSSNTAVPQPIKKETEKLSETQSVGVSPKMPDQHTVQSEALGVASVEPPVIGVLRLEIKIELVTPETK